MLFIQIRSSNFNGKAFFVETLRILAQLRSSSRVMRVFIGVNLCK